MNRINKVLEGKNNILSIYFTAGFPEIEDTEKIILKLALDNEAQLTQAKETFSTKDFSFAVHQELFKILSTLPDSEKTLQDQLFEKLENVETKKAYSEIQVSEPIEGDLNQIFEDCANVISINKLKVEVVQLKTQIAEAEKSGKIDKVKELHKEYTQLCEAMRETGVI